MAAARQLPTWLRVILNLCGPAGLGVTLMGWVRPALGIAVMAVGLVYVGWEIYPISTGWIRRRPKMSLLTFILAGAAFGALLWVIWKSLPRTSVVSPLPEQQESLDLLRKVEFLQHRTDNVSRVVFFVWLDRAYTPEELGSFRILMTVLQSPVGVIYISAADAYGKQDNSKGLLYGTQDTTWSADPDLRMSQVLQDATIMGSPQADRFDAPAGISRGLSLFMLGRSISTEKIDAWSGSGGPFSTLQAFDNAILTIDLSASLWPKVAYIGLAINDYLLLGQPRQCITISDPVHSGQPSKIDWPNGRRPSGDMKWVHVVPAGYLPGGRRPPILGFGLQFSAYTPLLMETFNHSKSQGSLAIPTCDWYGPNKP